MPIPVESQIPTSQLNYRLGLDIGAASIGWAVVALDDNGNPIGLHRAGVHLFEAGVEAGKSDIETALMKGTEQSKATPRRVARSMRRQTWRRRRRKRRLLGTLVHANLLPPGDFSTGEAIMRYLAELDRSLLEGGQLATGTHTDQQTRYYALRAQAAVEPVSAFALGRALYHLAQRRGFLSNRKTPEREDESLSKMKSKIGELAQSVDAHPVRTLGSYFASLDPDEQRIRGRWTSRQMYLDEFEQIWKTQTTHHDLTDEQRQAIHTAIFHQRPLRDQSHLVGRCSLTSHKRCPIAERIAQRFRVLQQVNHLRIVLDDFSERPLTNEERTTLLGILLSEGDISVAKAKPRLGLPRGITFSIERGGEKKLIGHRTDAKIRAIVGPALWDELDEPRRDELVHHIRSIREVDTLRRVARSRFNLTRDQATELAALTLEEGHAAHSRRALERLVPRMEHDGLSYAEAHRDEYPESFTSEQPQDLLPPIGDWNSDLRNPSVARALTEVRKLVNAIVRRWGKPDQIHLELARDLKAPRGRRERVARQMRERERERERAASAIADSLGVASPKGWMIEKWLLAEECGWQCPYTGRSFGASELIGNNSQFDIEHIWPFSSSLDNTFLNKTICYHEENRNRKRGRSPRNAYSQSELETILQRVKAFNTDPFTRLAKLKRFEQPIEDGFALRHLQETRYIGRLACEYLGTLYGGVVENQGTPGSRRRILTPSGGLVAWLRRGWCLDAVLSQDNTKNRNDHRHHAIDAIVIALSDQSAIQRIATAASQTERNQSERTYGLIDPPWEALVDDARNIVGSIIVSHRQSRKVRGRLHEDNPLSKRHADGHRISKPIEKLTPAEIASGKIINKRALTAIIQKLEEIGETSPSKAFSSTANRPTMPGENGKPVRLRRVRIRVGGNPRPFGSGHAQRFAKSGSNHHTVIREKRNAAGLVVGWVDEPVQLADLAGRINSQSESDPNIPSSGRIVMTLAQNDFIELDRSDGQGRAIYRVLNISEGDIEIRLHSDGRSSTEAKKTRAQDGTRVQGSSLFNRNARKVRVTYLGEIVNAGG